MGDGFHMQGVALFEGLPGSGKSGVSARVCERFAAAGVECSWAREESADHPFFGPAVRADRRREDFAQICLQRWSVVVDQARERMWMLDGCAFQSTVRYMFEQCVAFDDIRSYWVDAEEIAVHAKGVIVYLTQLDPRSHMRDRTLPRRGPNWTAKLVAHVESTRRGREHGNRGVDGMIDFWVDYRALCDDLISRSRLPVLEVDTSGSDWTSVEHETGEWIAQQLPAPSQTAHLS